jgi:hypothetical protein
MTTEQFTELMNELRAIRAVFAAKQSLAPAPAAPAASKPATADIPLPSEVIENPEDICVHFGKNSGTRLGNLSARSLEWYAQEPEPRLKKDGSPFPPREEDLLLRNAARTIVHQKRGTIPMPPAKPVLQGEPISEDVPF